MTRFTTSSHSFSNSPYNAFLYSQYSGQNPAPIDDTDNLVLPRINEDVRRSEIGMRKDDGEVIEQFIPARLVSGLQSALRD